MKIISVFSLFCACIYYIRYTYFGLSLEQLHHKVFEHLLQGLSMKVLSEQASVFVNLYWEELVYFPAWQRLRSAQHLGHFTFILSNSPSFLVGLLAEKFQVERWKASEYLVDHEQNLARIGSILQGSDKAAALQDVCQKLQIPLEETVAYSDSILDLCFLQKAGVAVAVNPDHRLKKISQLCSWEQI